jgi:hypothetical protein
MKPLINLEIFCDYLEYNRRVLWFAKLHYWETSGKNNRILLIYKLNI